jgi:hypothetical protein
MGSKSFTASVQARKAQSVVIVVRTAEDLDASLLVRWGAVVEPSFPGVAIMDSKQVACGK